MLSRYRSLVQLVRGLHWDQYVRYAQDLRLYIHLYTRLHRRPPAEADIQQYFRVTPPSVHQMVLTLEQAGFFRRQPRPPRSIELLVDPNQSPCRGYY